MIKALGSYFFFKSPVFSKYGPDYVYTPPPCCNFIFADKSSTPHNKYMKVPPVDMSIESRALARPPRRGIREDPSRNQLCTASVYPDA